MLRSLPFASTLAIAAGAVAVSLAALPALEARADDLQVATDPTPVTPAPTLATTNAARPTQVSRPDAPATFTSHTTFYGWQNILVGELGLATAIGTAMLDAAEAGSLGGLAYLFGGPSIHGLHDGGLGKVFGSFALNVGVPCVGAAIGALSAIDTDQDPGQNAAIGALIGMGVAPLVDGLTLGWETHRVLASGSAARLPMVGLSKTRGGWTASVAGAF